MFFFLNVLFQLQGISNLIITMILINVSVSEFKPKPLQPGVSTFGMSGGVPDLKGKIMINKKRCYNCYDQSIYVQFSHFLSFEIFLALVSFEIFLALVKEYSTQICIILASEVRLCLKFNRFISTGSFSSSHSESLDKNIGKRFQRFFKTHSWKIKPNTLNYRFTYVVHTKHDPFPGFCNSDYGI